MRALLRLASIIFFGLVFFVMGQLFWARFVKGEDLTLEKAIDKTGQNLSGLPEVLGLSVEKDDLGEFVRTDVAEFVQERLEESEIVDQIEKQVDYIASQAGEVRELPAAQAQKLKKDISQEICNQLLGENE